MLNPHQFAPPGDEKARKRLLKQLKPDFPSDALDWLRDPAVRVEAPQRIPATDLDFDDYPNWRASHELKKVNKIARKKKNKDIVVADRPGEEDLYIIDGHHHALAKIDREKDPKGYIVHVPAREGPWTKLHDRQKGDQDTPDFPGERDADRD